MGSKAIFFDFDETLVDTSELRPYRQTAEGRRFITDYPDQINTKLINPDILTLFNKLAQTNLSVIATNSAFDYTITLLKKHRFRIDIPVYYNLHKPCHDDLSCAIIDQCAVASDSLYVGDSASDIIAAHGCRMPSVAVTWGNTSTPAQLKKAEPTRIARNVNELRACIGSFSKGELNYVERIDPDGYIFSDDPPDEVDIEFHSLYTYYPTRHPNFYNSKSNGILRFKDIKDFSFNEIRGGATGSYFYNGEIKSGLLLKDVFNEFYLQMSTFLNSLELKGNSYVVAAPNSAPEFCYKSDVNQIMANILNHNLFKIERAYLKRIFFRIFPKRESHLNGARSEAVHFETIGVKETDGIPKNLQNIIIFDDITTTRTQIKCLAKILKTFFNFDGSLLSVTLGKTIDEY
jgi:phosphoglycolate phosphatase-like HAD superfamily hydrolase